MEHTKEENTSTVGTNSVEMQILDEKKKECHADSHMLVFLQHLTEEKTSVYESVVELCKDDVSGLDDHELAPLLPCIQHSITESIRLTYHNQSFILIFLDRSQLQLLPMLPYAMLCVGMKMCNNSQVLLKQLGSVDWPLMDLDYPNNKPRILLSYNMDVWNRREEEEFPAMVKHTMRRVNRQGLKCAAIPRYVNFAQKTLFCDFLSGCQALLDDPGYFLQQCAHFNDVFNLKIVLPQCNEEAMNRRDDSSGDNPAMLAAKMRHKEALSLILGNLRQQQEIGTMNIWDLIHARNSDGQTLLHMVTIQGPELEEQKIQILRLEIPLHCLSEETHARDQISLKRCMRDQLKSSADSTLIQRQLEYMQGIPKTEHELKMEKCRIWSSLFFSVLLLGVTYSTLDYGSDIILVTRYGHEINETSRAKVQNDCRDLWQNGDMISIKCFPESMAPNEKFYMTLLFILWPYPFFIYAYLSSRQFKIGLDRVHQLIINISKCSGLFSVIRYLFYILGYILIFFGCCLVWPIAIQFIKFYQDAKFYLSKDMERVERENKREKSEVLWNMSRAMEVSFESSFQPTLQLYLFFPTLFSLTESNEWLNIQLLKYEDGVLQPAQLVSVLTSVISLSWGFTSYYCVLKRGDMEKDVASLLRKIVFFLSLLFLIIPRLLVFVFFAYSLGPGNYKYLFVFIICHGFLMMIIHYILSDARTYIRKGCFSFLHHMVGNGFANIYVHNWIRTRYPPVQHVSTLVRQLVMDIVILTENAILLCYALNSNIKELQERQLLYSCFILGLHIAGLVLKIVFYRYLHSWAWLIMDYSTTMDQDTGWLCTLHSDMFLLGELSPRKLTLCCVPSICVLAGKNKEKKETIYTVDSQHSILETD